jgi:hypothetical protein
MLKLVDLAQGALDAGVSPATTVSSTPIWKSASNVVFSEGAVRPEPGQALLFQKQSTDPVIGFGEIERAGRQILVWGTKSKLFRGDRIAASPVTDISGAAYTGITDATDEEPATRWSIQPWGEWAVFANGKDELQIFKPSNSTALTPGHASMFAGAYKRPLEHEAAGVVFRPYFVARVRSFMLAACHHKMASSASDNEIADGEQTVWWCDSNNIADWFPTSNNLAGSLPIRDLGGPIKAFHPFQDGAAAYSENNLVIIQYLGAPLVFGAVRTLAGVGAFGPHSVVQVGQVHYGAGNQGLWRTNGNEVDHFDAVFVRDWFLSKLTRSQRSKVVAWSDLKNSRVVWFFPGEGSLIHNKAIAFNYETGSFHIPGYVRTAASLQEVFNYPITAGLDGSIWEQSSGDAAGASPGNPLALIADYTITTGYGGGGYGTFGYGGTGSGVG